MNNRSNKNHSNGLCIMKPKTRSFFLANFRRQNGSIDSHCASAFFHVTTRTINNWLVTGCPAWVDHYVALYERSIPDTKDWDGFSFSRGRLITPYERLTFAPSDLLKVHYDRQFNQIDRVEREQLQKAVNNLRNDDEAAAIRDEIDFMIKTLNKLKQSPIVAHAKGYHEKVSKKR